jgi:hypothetical protein
MARPPHGLAGRPPVYLHPRHARRRVAPGGLAVCPDQRAVPAGRPRSARFHHPPRQDAARVGPPHHLRVLPPGGLVVDPMCGIGTTLVEAVALGHRAVGVELEARWAELARANPAFTLAGQQARRGQVRLGNARHLTRMLADLAGTVDLVATSPPYSGDVGMIDKRAWLAGRSLCRATRSTTGPTTPTLVTPAATATWQSWPTSTKAALAYCGPAATGHRHQESPPPRPGTGSGHCHRRAG